MSFPTGAKIVAAALAGALACCASLAQTPSYQSGPYPVPAKPAAPVTPPPPPPTSAARMEIVAGPPVNDLVTMPDRAVLALQAFHASCPALMARADLSGLTRSGDWAAACADAATWAPDKAIDFFVAHFETVQLGDGKTLATGYFIPEILGSRQRKPGFDVPIYRRPADLIDVDLGAFSESLRGRRVAGRVEGKKLVPYADRKGIDEGAMTGKGLELAWAADPVDFFFLQIQGSGRLRLPDGSVMTIGYDGQNGRDFTGLGRLLLDRGLVPSGQASMQGIVAYLRALPDGGRALMQENRSYVFFRELPGKPLGALGVEVTGQVSAAADPNFIPLGAPFVVGLDSVEASGLWVAQDTGGAIKGPNRFDTFWGHGADAARIAGGLAARGQTWLLLPIGTLARLKGVASGGPQPQH